MNNKMVYTRSKSRTLKRKISEPKKTKSFSKRRAVSRRPKQIVKFRGITYLPDHLTLSELYNEPLQLGKVYVGWVNMTAVKMVETIENGQNVKRETHDHFAGTIWRPEHPDESIPIQLSTSELMQHFVLSKFCGDEVRSSYVRGSLNYATHVFFVFYPTIEKRKSIVFHSLGFITGYKINPEIFYIDVICAEKNINYSDINGKFIMLFVEKLLYKIGIREIQLSAIPYVLLYYPKQLNYRHRQSCASPPEFEHFTPNLLHRLKTARDTLPKTNLDALDDLDFLHYMVQLFKAGYITNKYCDPINRETGEFKTDMELVDMLIGSQDCQGDGFKMRKCLD